MDLSIVLGKKKIPQFSALPAEQWKAYWNSIKSGLCQADQGWGETWHWYRAVSLWSDELMPAGKPELDLFCETQIPLYWTSLSFPTDRAGAAAVGFGVLWPVKSKAENKSVTQSNYCCWSSVIPFSLNSGMLSRPSSTAHAVPSLFLSTATAPAPAFQNKTSLLFHKMKVPGENSPFLPFC